LPELGAIGAARSITTDNYVGVGFVEMAALARAISSARACCPGNIFYATFIRCPPVTLLRWVFLE